MRLIRLTQAIAVNAVLLGGLFWLGWTAATVIALYWFESLLAAILIAVRIYVHRKLTNKSGHYVLDTWKFTGKYGTTTRTRLGTVLQGYLIFALGFTLAHGVFIVPLVIMLDDPATAFRRDQFLRGIATISAVLIVGLIADLVTIRRQPFAWIKLMTSLMYARVVIMQLVIIIGFGIAIVTNSPRFVVILFLTLKLGLDFLRADMKADPVKALIDESEEGPFDDAARARLLGE